MRNIKIKSGLALLTLTLSGWAFAGDLTKVNPHAPALAQMNQAFLNEDFKAMTAAMKKVLMEHPNDEVVQAKVYSLLNRAQSELGRLGMPVEQKLPEAIQRLKISVKRRQGENPRFGIMVSANVKEDLGIEQVRLTRYPKEVLIDTREKIGEDEAHYEKQYPRDFSAQTRKSYSKIQPGLYLIHIELKNASPFEGWVILTPDINSTGDADLGEYKDLNVVRGDKVELSWKPFRSPEYKPFESSLMTMSISKVGIKDDWELKWDHSLVAPTKTSVKIKEEGEGVKELEPGKYSAGITFYEQRLFGDIAIRRGTTVSHEFTVEK